MTDKRIIGLDIGTYSVKAVYLDPKGELSVVGFEQELVAAAVAPAAAQPSSPAPPPLPGTAAFEEEATNVREAPDPAGEPPEVPASADASIEIAEDAPAWLPALQRLGARGGLEAEYVVTFVPDTKAMTIQLDVPFAERAKAASILPHLMLDRLPMNQSEIVWDFQTHPALQPGAEGARALVGFSRNDDTATLLAHLGEVSVDPVVLGIPELFLGSVGVRSIGGPPTDAVAFIDLGHENTRVVVMRGYDPLLARTIRTGGRQITEAMAEAFDVDFAEAEKIKHQYAAIVEPGSNPNEQMRLLSEAVRAGLRPVVRDLRRSFQGVFAKDRIEVSRVYICGGTSQIRNIEKFLAEELGLPVKRLQLAVEGVEDARVGAVAQLAVAAGIVFQAEGVRQRTINLRRARFAYRGKSSYLRRQLTVAAAAAVALLMILGVTLLVQKESREAQRDAMRAALARETKSLFGAELTSKDQIQKAMAGEDSAANAFVPQMSAYELLYELTTNVSDDIEFTLDRLEVDADRNLIQIYGETTDAQAVDKIVSDLEKIECLKEIKKDKLKVKGDKADFELQISSGCS